MYEAVFEPISNRADWVQLVELIDGETDEIVTDLSGISVVLEVRDRECRTPRLIASTENGKVTDLGGGILQWFFPRSEMTALCSGSYEIGVTLARDGITSQYIIGVLPILDGIVSK